MEGLTILWLAPLVIWVFGLLGHTPLHEFLLENRWPVWTCLGSAAVALVAAYADHIGLVVAASSVIWVVVPTSVYNHFKKKRRSGR